MNRVLYLADGKKCIASACRNPQPCARRDVQYQPGMWVGDFSIPSSTYLADCRPDKWVMHVPHSEAVKPVEQKQSRDWIGQ